jgi:hypothetical protein
VFNSQPTEEDFRGKDSRVETCCYQKNNIERAIEESGSDEKRSINGWMNEIDY